MRFPFTRKVHRAGTRQTLTAADASLQVGVRGAMLASVDGRRFEILAGSALYQPAGTRYDVVCDGEVELLVIAVPPMLVGGVTGERTSRAWSINLLRECATREPGWELMADGWTTVGLAHLERLRMLASARPVWLDEVVDLARANRTLAEIAREIGRHPSHIAREFRRHEGVSVGEYARRCRLELAARELRATAAPLSKVALGAGFCDQSHFTNVFRRVFGVTPAEYRRGSR